MRLIYELAAVTSSSHFPVPKQQTKKKKGRGRIAARICNVGIEQSGVRSGRFLLICNLYLLYKNF